MFCPHCSQQQPSSEVRFCTRCGFPLGGVARLLDGGGELASDDDSAPRPRLTKRQRGMREAVVAMVAGLLFFGVAALLTAYKEDFFVLLPVAALVFVGGLIRLLHAALLEDDVPASHDAKTPAVTARAGAATAVLEETRARGGELPPARGFSAADFTRTRANTSEMAAPASVTENTTKLLEDEEGR